MSLPTQNISNLHAQKALIYDQNENIRSRIDVEQNKLSTNKERLDQLQKEVEGLKQKRADKISTIDELNRVIKKYKEHQALLPLIKQLRAHYKKLKQFGNEGEDIDVDEMSYEQLLQLGQKIGKVPKGISEQQFMNLERTCCMITQQCSICQDDLTLGVQCIKLSCGHMYDVECLKQWVKMEKICPLCKAEII